MEKSKVLLLDGGFASQLIENGFEDIDSDPLWSARLLKTNPEAVKSELYNLRQLMCKQ